jgi:hypothetical protein
MCEDVRTLNIDLKIPGALAAQSVRNLLASADYRLRTQLRVSADGIASISVPERDIEPAKASLFVVEPWDPGTDYVGPRAAADVSQLPFAIAIADFHSPGSMTWTQTGLIEYLYGKRCGIEGITLHSLRHTFASRVVQAGLSLVEIQSLLGHSSPVTSLRYAHLVPNQATSKAAIILDRLNGSASPA